MGFEDKIIKFKGTDAFADKELKERLLRKVEVYNKKRFKPEAFSDCFSSEDIRRDTEEVSQLQTIFKQNLNKEREKYPDDPTSGQIENIGAITEFIVAKHISTWFANLIKAHPTAEFDDYKNNIDLVLEYIDSPENSKYIGLGLDVTFSTNKEIINKKLDRIWNYDLREGKPASVKYFESSDKKVHGSIEVPRVVVALDPRMVKELMRLEDKNKIEELDNHPVQIVILYQLQQQFGAFHKRAISRDDAGHKKVANMYRAAVEQFNKVIEKKQEYINDNMHVLSDDIGARLVQEFFEGKER